MAILKSGWGAACAAALAASVQAAPAPAAHGEIAQQVNFKFWSLSDSGDKGWQMVAPLDVTYSVPLSEKTRLDVSGRTAYVISENRSPLQEGRVAGLSDTVIGTTLTIDLTPVIQPFITLDLNVPTGKTGLKGAQKNAVMDPDLVDLVRFGEGFNTNLSIGAVFLIPETSWSITAAAGYNARGAYVADGDTLEDFDPGDQLTALLRAQYLSETIYGALSVQYFDEDVSTIEGLDYFNPGNQIEINAELTYVIDEVQSVSGSLYYTTSGKNAYYDFFTDAVIEENVDGNGDYFFGQLAYSRTLSEEIGATVAATYGVRTKNDYVAADDLFIPSRTYWDVRVSMDYTAPGGWVAAADIGYGGVNDDGTILVPGDRSYETFSAGLALSYAL
jgi:hypothetical protein